MADGDNWLPTWFQQWVAAVYDPAHKIFAEDISTVKDAQMQTASAVQRIEFKLDAQLNRGKTIQGFARDWAGPAVMLVLFLLDRVIR